MTEEEHMKCDLDNCSLAEDVKERNGKIDKIHEAVIAMTAKLEIYVPHNKEQHDALFELSRKTNDKIDTRTKNTVKVSHLFLAVGAVCAIIGTVYTISLIGGR